MSQHIPPDRKGARPMAMGILVGIFRLATGRADGFARFEPTSQAFMTSLAPLLGLPIVGFLMMLANGLVLAGLSDLLATCCAVLAPPVISHALARAWGREAEWMRFAVAFNWCQWVIPMAMALVLLGAEIAVDVGVPIGVAGALAILLLAGYGLWLHFFLARRGLGLSRGRSALLVLAVNAGTLLLAVGPRLLVYATA
jgi:hypothetical protein